MMRPQPIAPGNYAWAEVPVEKIRSSEVAGFSSLKEDCDKEVSPERSLSCIKDA